MAVTNLGGMDVGNAVTGTVGLGAGVGSTLLVRQRLDQTGETTVLRPSVLYGVGTGLTAMAIPLLMGGGRGALWEGLASYGGGALAAGVFSAFSPKGGGVQVPTL